MKSPKNPNLTDAGFAHLCDYTELLSADAEEFLAHYQDMIDWEEVIDHYLFISYIYAYDNKLNNIYYAASPDESGLHMQFVPWDLDCAFGYSNWLYVLEDGSTEQHYLNRMPFKGMEETHAILALQKYAPEMYSEMLSARWRQLRTTVLTTQKMTDKVSALFDTLEASGAYHRDGAIWNEYFQLEPDEEEYLTNFLRTQLTRLDNIILYNIQ